MALCTGEFEAVAERSDLDDSEKTEDDVEACASEEEPDTRNMGLGDYDDARVHLEREEHEERMVRHNRNFQMINDSWTNMQAKLRQQIPCEPMADSIPSCSPVMDAEYAATQRMRKAKFVSSELRRRKHNSLDFQRRRRRLLDAQEQARVDEAARQAEDDIRRSERADERWKETQRKIFDRRLVRCEQQTTLRELQREQQRIYDDLNQKHHAAAYGKESKDSGSHLSSGSTVSGPGSTSICSLTSAASAPSLPSFAQSSINTSMMSASPLNCSVDALLKSSKSSSTGFLPSVIPGDEEDIYRHTVRSHSLYEGTLTKWNQMVVENERRADADWEKMLIRTGGDRDDPFLVARARGRMMSQSSTNVRRMSAFAKSFGCKEDSQHSLSMFSKKAASAGLLPELSPMRTCASQEGSPADHDTVSFSSRQPMVSPSRYIDPTRSHDFFDSARDRWMTKTNTSLAKRKEQKTEVAQAAKARNSLWHERNIGSSQCRVRYEDARTDPRNLDRTMDRIDRANDERDVLLQSLSDGFGGKWKTMQEVKSTASALDKKKQRQLVAKQGDKHDTFTGTRKTQLEYWQETSGAHSMEHSEETVKKLEIKKRLDIQHRRSAKDDIAQKHVRSTNALERVHTTQIAKGQAKKHMERELRLQAEAAKRALQSSEDGSEVADEDGSLGHQVRESIASDDAKASISASSAVDDTKSSKGRGTVTEQGSFSTAKVSLFGQSDCPQQNDLTDVLSNASSAGQEFLSDLNTECENWTQTMRKQQDPFKGLL